MQTVIGRQSSSKLRAPAGVSRLSFSQPALMCGTNTLPVAPGKCMLRGMPPKPLDQDDFSQKSQLGLKLRFGIRSAKRLILRILTSLLLPLSALSQAAEVDLRVSFFHIDATPPIGSPLAYNRCDGVGMPLSARGVVLHGGGQPIVLCAVDWIGISNEGHKRWKQTLARAVGTVPEKISVHTLHQHDAPRCDLSAEQLLQERGLEGMLLDPEFVEQTLKRVGAAAQSAMETLSVVTHLGLGEAEVHQVASTRRILGPDGKVRATRFTACKDPLLRAEPEGVIDPKVKSVSFWNDDTLLIVLTWYATHPQSYYLTGRAHPDFPGMARGLREATLNGVPHIHFNGAGGDIGAGKYNDGSPENRQQLAIRLADGMSRALVASERLPISRESLLWNTAAVRLPIASHLSAASLRTQLEDSSRDPATMIGIAEDLAWAERCEKGESIDLHCLSLGKARLLFMPGECSVAYQLAAQRMRPDQFVTMAAYGDYAPGYICTEAQYAQGGYEASPRASRVAPQVEGVLMEAMRQLLDR